MKLTKDMTLHEALAELGVTSRKGTDDQRRSLYDSQGGFIASCDAKEAWALVNSLIKEEAEQANEVDANGDTHLSTTAYMLGRAHTCPKCEHSNIPCVTEVSK